MIDPASVALLVRMWISESGWDSARDHAAQGSIMVAAAEKSDLRTAIHRRVDRFSLANVRHPWLVEIDSSCRAPILYPGKWPVEKCRILVDRAIDLLQGRIADPCRGKATGWRAKWAPKLHGKRKSKALRKALKKGYTRVWCGRTNNAYVNEKRNRKP